MQSQLKDPLNESFDPRLLLLSSKSTLVITIYPDTKSCNHVRLRRQFFSRWLIPVNLITDPQSNVCETRIDPISA